MSTRNWIRTAVVVGLVAWPAVEGYRLFVAQQQLAQAVQQNERVSTKLAQARSEQMARQQKEAVTPVNNPSAAQPKGSSTL
jgi:hypothetical protein